MQNTNSGIYRIENIITRKVYIGQAANLKKRYYNHISALRRNKHDNKYLQNAWNKYDEQDFVFSILEECSIEKLGQQEQYWMDYYECYDRTHGYNINPSSTENPMLGKTHTLETKEKISQKAKGRKMSEANFKALMKANTKVPKPDKNLNKNYSKKRQENAPVRNIKYEYHILKPEGEYIMLTNLNEFCDINRCSISHLRSLIFKNSFYKGWEAIAIPLKPQKSSLLPKIKLQLLKTINFNHA